MKSYLVVAVACMTAASSAEAEHALLRVNPGLWEISVVTHIKGQLPIPDSALAKLPADQRAKLMASMQSMVVAPKPHKFKECMTAQKIAEGFEVEQEQGSCKRTVVSNTSSLMEISEKCDTSDGTTTGHFRFQASCMSNVTGALTMNIANGGKNMNMDGTIDGHWLGGSCGAIKDLEVEQ